MRVPATIRKAKSRAPDDIAVVSEHIVSLPNLPAGLSGLRVAHITDLHRSRLTSDFVLREAISRINELRPDLIIITGDFVTNTPADIAPCAEIVSCLRARLGVYGCLGNHDYTAGAAKVRVAMANAGVTILVNSSAEIAPGLRIVGLDEDRHGRPDIVRAWQDVQPDDATLALVHNPGWGEKLGDRSCVIFCGHTHGGQIKLPFLTAREVRRIGAKHYVEGWFKFERARMYVNRGLGQVGFAARFRCPPEIALFTLEAS